MSKTNTKTHGNGLDIEHALHLAHTIKNNINDDYDNELLIDELIFMLEDANINSLMDKTAGQRGDFTP